MSTLVTQTISNGTVSTSSANVIQGCAKAWVNFNGVGTVTIRASYNVSSITDNGTGDYTVNFTNTLPDANYAALATAQPDTSAGIGPSNGQCTLSVVGTSGGASLPSTSGFRIFVGYAGANPRDVSGMYVAVFD
jgi:hypothetical protein